MSTVAQRAGLHAALLDHLEARARAVLERNARRRAAGRPPQDLVLEPEELLQLCALARKSLNGNEKQ